MTELEIHQALEQSALEVLATMFFIDAVPAGRAPDAPHAIKIAFEGELSGSLLLHIAPEAASAIAANFLGADPSALSSHEIAEVSAELANMICGAALSRLDTAATFRLSSPRLVAVPEPPGSGPAVRLDTGDGLLSISITTEVPICLASLSAF